MGWVEKRATKRAAALILSAGVLWVSLAGCSPETKYRLLSFFFDGVPKPGEEEPAKKPRRAKAPEAAPVPKPAPPAPAKPGEAPAVGPAEAVSAAERSTRWEEVGPLLPKDDQGEVDWMKALSEGVIKPRSSLDPKGPELQVLPLDFALVPEGMPEYESVFRHSTHTQWSNCETCHPKLFAMQKGADVITMEKISAGESCGLCHGTVAFAVEPNCAVCHTALKGGS